MSTGLSRHKLTLVWVAIVNQGAARGRRGEGRGGGQPGLTNNVSVSLDKQVNIDLVENYSQGYLPPSPPLLAQLISLFNWFLCEQR